MAVASSKAAIQPVPDNRGAPPDLTKEQELKAFREMLLIRRFEEKAGQMYGMGLIGGFCHLYIGQEAVVVGMQMALKAGDQVITGYRDHGHMLACGMDSKGVMAELTGRRGGYSKGKGGSMHMFSVEKGFFGGHGIVAAQVPLGTGLAFANRYRGNDNVSLTYFGDGAANQGQVYESFNMAKLWKLPVIYIIENNQYAMGTSVNRASATTNLAMRGSAHGIPGEQVDGMDVRAVKAAGEKAVKWCRDGNGPIILEMLTYRYRGHSMSDPAKYRSKEEVDKYRTEHDPIEQVRAAAHCQEMEQRGRAEEDRHRSSPHRQRGGGVRDPRPRAGSLGALHRRLRLTGTRMATVAYIVAGLAVAGAVASWIVGAVFYVRTLRAISQDPQQRGLMSRAIFAWMFTVGRLQGAAAAHASIVNKALVAFLVCVIVAVAAISVGDQSRAGFPLVPLSRPTERVHADRSPDARALADHGAGQPCQMAQERGRHGQVRRRHRRDRDRQGDHGGRGGRRRHARQDPGAGRDQRRRGQHADRDDPVRRRRRRCAEIREAASRKPQSAPGDHRAGRGIPAARRGARRDQGAARGAQTVDARRARSSRRHRDRQHDRPRSVARRHGRGDAPRSQRVRDGRGSRRVSGRLQGHARACCRSSARGA